MKQHRQAEVASAGSSAPDPLTHAAPTPGPWHTGNELGGNYGQEARYSVRDRDSFIVADVWADCVTLRPHARANAHLIAAAPELLESCRELRVAGAALMRIVAQHVRADIVDRFAAEMDAMGMSGFGTRAQAAIAKAEGRS